MIVVGLLVFLSPFCPRWSFILREVAALALIGDILGGFIAAYFSARHDISGVSIEKLIEPISLGMLVGSGVGVLFCVGALIRAWKAGRKELCLSASHFGDLTKDGSKKEIDYAIVILTKFGRALVTDWKYIAITAYSVFALFIGVSNQSGVDVYAHKIIFVGSIIVLLGLNLSFFVFVTRIPEVNNGAITLGVDVPYLISSLFGTVKKFLSGGISSGFEEETRPSDVAKSVAAAMWALLNIVISYAVLYATMGFHTTDQGTCGIDPKTFIWHCLDIQLGAGSQAFDALYYSVTTIATVGFGDITPKTTLARFVTIVEILNGFLLLGSFISFLWFALQKASNFSSDKETGNSCSAVSSNEPIGHSKDVPTFLIQES